MQGWEFDTARYPSPSPAQTGGIPEVPRVVSRLGAGRTSASSVEPGEGRHGRRVWVVPRPARAHRHGWTGGTAQCHAHGRDLGPARGSRLACECFCRQGRDAVDTQVIGRGKRRTSGCPLSPQAARSGLAAGSPGERPGEGFTAPFHGAVQVACASVHGRDAHLHVGFASSSHEPAPRDILTHKPNLQ